MADDPASALLARLERARAVGLEFGPAWLEAIAATVAELRTSRFERETWREAFAGTREVWGRRL
jgi:hypothetical protein